MGNDFFGVFFTCFTENKAVEYSLDLINSIYKNIPIYLVSDGGNDFSFLNEKYNIKTKIEKDSRSFIPGLNKDNYLSLENQKKIKESIITFLNRIYNAILFCNKKYLLIMEPDVLVRGILSDPKNNKLLGSCINRGLSEEIKYILRNTNNAIEIDGWGATPALFETESFLVAYKNIINNDLLLDELCRAEYRLSNYDVLLPVIFSLIGIKESFNPDIVECFRDDNWENCGKPLVHQYRAKYPLKSEGYQGTHIKHQFGLGDNWKWKR